jgi:hypothetical protein
MCAFHSARPPRCGRVVVDVSMLFHRRRAGFHVLLRAEYNSRLFFPCASVAGAPQSCTHEHDEERERDGHFLYRCSIEFSSVLYIFLLACLLLCIILICQLSLRARVSRFRYGHVVERATTFELRRIQDICVN